MIDHNLSASKAAFSCSKGLARAKTASSSSLWPVRRRPKGQPPRALEYHALRSQKNPFTSHHDPVTILWWEIIQTSRATAQNTFLVRFVESWRVVLSFKGNYRSIKKSIKYCAAHHSEQSLQILPASAKQVTSYDFHGALFLHHHHSPKIGF